MSDTAEKDFSKFHKVKTVQDLMAEIFTLCKKYNDTDVRVENKTPHDMDGVVLKVTIS